jgi:hypothetical protein
MTGEMGKMQRVTNFCNVVITVFKGGHRSGRLHCSGDFARRTAKTGAYGFTECDLSDFLAVPLGF